MFRSATFKLTIWYLAIAMAISLLFSAVVYGIGTGEIARSLNLQTDRIYRHFPIFSSNPILRTGSDIDATDHRLLLKLVFLNIIVFILAGIASYILARRTLDPIEEAHEQQKRFTSDVSHELRTPLTALKMESEVALLSPKITSSELKATLKSNLEEASKLERLINSILRLSRLEADELRQNFTVISTGDVVNEAVKQTKVLAKQHHLSINQEVKDLPIYGERESLIQLLVILIDNAIKYSGQAKNVLIKTSKRENMISISVIDHGVGISKDSLEHIFDRFYRSESSRNKEQGKEGYGLGLSIAKMIADVHEGVITVSSELGKGTEVEVSLPIHK